MAEYAARVNERIRIELRDFPVIKGLQESIYTFKTVDPNIGLERIGLERILSRAVPKPPADLPYSEETKTRLPAGGISLGLARTFKIIQS